MAAQMNDTASFGPLDKSALSPRMAELVKYFENLDRLAVGRMDQIYAANAYFKDPFNEVNDLASIKHIFDAMFDQVDNPRFVVHTSIEQGNEAFIAWDFLFQMQRFKAGQEQRCRGSSHLRFDEHDKIIFHRDYWDTSEELYEKIPVLGSLMRWLKKQAG